MFVGQAHYLDDRLVVTYGLRQDKSNIRAENYTAAADGTYSPWNHDGFWVDPSKATPREDWSSVRDTASHGVEMQFVFTPIPNWRISANASRNITKSSNLIPEVVAYIATNHPMEGSDRGLPPAGRKRPG